MDTLQVTTPDPMFERRRWTTYDQSNGLVGVVRDIYEDRDGNVWFGTDEGAQRYDGLRWTTYTTNDGLAHDSVWKILQTRDGAIWFGTFGGGISQLAPSGSSKNTRQPDRTRDPVWTTYTTKDGLATELVGSLIQTKDGTIWAGSRSGDPNDSGTRGGISRFDGERWEIVEVPVGPSRPTIVDILEARDGALWFTTWNHGILRLDNTGWTRYSTENGLPNDRLGRLMESEDGTLWFAHGRAGVTRFDPAIARLGQNAWKTYNEADGLPITNQGFLSVWQTNDGAIWCGGPHVVCRLEGDRWEAYSGYEMWGSDVHRAFGYPARDGAVWITDSGRQRARRFAPVESWNIYSDAVSTILGSGIAAKTIFAIDDDLWFADPRGAVQFDGSIWTRHTVVDGLIEGRVTSVLKGKDGSIWVAGQHRGRSGAARYDGTSWRVFSTQEGLAGEGIHNGQVASNGDIWFGTKWGMAGAGAIRYDGRNWKVYTTEDGLIHDVVYDIVEAPDGAMWFGTLGGISRFDPGIERAGTSSRPDNQVAWTNFTPAESGWQVTRTLCVARDGSLWAGYGTFSLGVTRYDGSAWKRYTIDDGLGGNTVYRILETRDGVLWFGTDGGLTRFDGDTWTTYAPDTIPIPFRTAFNTITEGPDNALWVAGSPELGQIARFVPDRESPETQIESTPDRISSAGHVFLKWSGTDHWEQTLRKDLRYRWHLDDDDWSRWSSRTDVTLTSLDSGPHTIEVQAADASMNVDATPATHAFIVEAPWWRNPVVAGPGLLIISFALFQTARVVQAKRKLQDSVDALSSANNELFQVNVDLQREQVLERLRGQAQGMQSSEDIKPVVEAVYRELTGLGLPLISSAISIYVSETEIERWTTGEDGRALESFTIVPPQGGSPVGRARREARRRGDDYYHHHVEGEEVREALQGAVERGNPLWQGIPEERWPQRMDAYSIFFEGGSISAAAEEPIAEEYLMLIKRFGEVFGYAHQRWEELKQKEAQNRLLAVEASVQRLRAEVQSMDEASDFERILSLLTESLKTVELTFDGCEIDVLDEPVENPTMAHFEANGFRYTTFRLDPNGDVTSNSHNLAAPFPSVIEQTVERFIAGQPWQGTSEGVAIVEVPAGSYGRLRLTASDRDSFTDDEVATLREFADAVALGYARYLDIREIQEQTERKSAFLASMSHEFRTPMNTIKGFTNLVLSRAGDLLPDRHKENLQKVDRASDHLLAMINDLLDLSKIEAGRMDVNPERFDVGELVTSACDTVSPLIQEGVELRQDVADNIGEANTDKARLQQMVINLLSNAIKFTESGSVTVSATREPGTGNRKTQGSTPDRGSRPTDDGSSVSDLVIAVSDTGKGIPTEELPTISMNTVRLKGRRAACRREPGWGCRLRRSSRSCWVGRLVWRARWGRAARLR